MKLIISIHHMSYKEVSLDEVMYQLASHGDTQTIGIINCMGDDQIKKLLDRVSWVADDICRGVSKDEGIIENAENNKDRKVRIFPETFQKLVDGIVRNTRIQLNPPHKIIKAL